MQYLRHGSDSVAPRRAEDLVSRLNVLAFHSGAFRAIKRLLHTLGRSYCAEIDQRARLRRDRNRAYPRPIRCRQDPSVVNNCVLAPVPDVHRNEHLDHVCSKAVEAMKRRRRSVRSQTLRPAVEAGGENILVPGSGRRREPENSRRHAFGDAAINQSTKLGARDSHAVRVGSRKQAELPPGDGRQFADWQRFPHRLPLQQDWEDSRGSGRTY